MPAHGLDLRSDSAGALAAALERDPALARRPQLILDAARFARLDALKLLVRAGADPNAAWRGYRPLHALIQERAHGETEATRERLKCLEWLLSHGADPEQLGAWPPARAVLVAAFTGSAPFVDRLRDGGARIDAFAVCALGDAARVRREVAKDAEFPRLRDVGGLTALQCVAASRMGRADAGVRKRLLEIAAMLLDHGADPAVTTKSWSHHVDAVYFAVSARHGEMLDLLLARGADATAALSSAVWDETDDLAEIALRRGADVNRAVAEDRPLLNEMIRWGRLRAVLWLLRHGTDPNRADERGWTALHQAASRGSARMVSALIEAGGDLRRKDAGGDTPADVAVDRERTKLIPLLESKR